MLFGPPFCAAGWWLLQSSLLALCSVEDFHWIGVYCRSPHPRLQWDLLSRCPALEPCHTFIVYLRFPLPTTLFQESFVLLFQVHMGLSRLGWISRVSQRTLELCLLFGLSVVSDTSSSSTPVNWSLLLLSFICTFWGIYLALSLHEWCWFWEFWCPAVFLLDITLLSSAVSTFSLVVLGVLRSRRFFMRFLFFADHLFFSWLELLYRWLCRSLLQWCSLAMWMGCGLVPKSYCLSIIDN